MTRKRTSESDLTVSAGSAAVTARRKAPVRGRAKRAPLPGEASAEPQSSSEAVVHEPTQEEIAQLAYLYWEARGYQGGSSEEDWLRAEQELRVRVAAATA